MNKFESPNLVQSNAEVRHKITSVMLLLVVFVFFVAGLLGIFQEFNMIQNVFLKSIKDLRRVSFLALLLSGVGLGIFVAHRQTDSNWYKRFFVLSICLYIVYAMPRSLFSTGVSQATLVPIVIATVICDLQTLIVIVALTYGLLNIKFAGTAGMSMLVGHLIFFLLAGLLVTFRWLWEREQSRATFLALYDPLTKLPNRRFLVEHLTELLNQKDSTAGQVALLHVDIDQFARINDTFGNEVGDKVLQGLSQRLQSLLHPGDFVACVGGNEFVVLSQQLHLQGALSRFTDRLLSQLNQPMQIGNSMVRLTVSMGGAVTPEDGERHYELMRSASQALYEAKARGGDQFSRASQNLHILAQRRFELTQELHGALERDEFFVVFQPIIDLQTGGVNKAEALIRWRHPVEGLIGPGEFIPVAESNGLIHELGEWVFREAATQAQRWREKGADGFQVSINRSPIQIKKDVLDLHPCIQLLDELNIPPDTVALELTEGVLLDATDKITGSLQNLRNCGVQLSLDDFGTGYSSLSHLNNFDMDLVKIDRCFVTKLEEGSKDHILCQSIVALAHSLGLKVVAEGIETQSQLELLKRLGCDYGQGYYIGKPMEAEAFEQSGFLKTQ